VVRPHRRDAPNDGSVSVVDVGEHAAALREVGIESVDQLAAADPDHLANVTSVSPAVLDEWVKQGNRRRAKSTRPPLLETTNGKRLRQGVGWIMKRVATARAIVVRRLTEPVKRDVRLLRTQAMAVQTWIRDDALPAGVALASRRRTVGQRGASKHAAQVRAHVRQLAVQGNDALGWTNSGLESIHGIGPAYSERLINAEITTVDELARSDPERVAASIGVSPKHIYRWTAQARSAEWIGQRLRRRIVIQIVKTAVSVAALRDPKPAPLDAAVTSRAWGSLDAPSEAAMRRLSTVGIESVFQLAAADPDRLAAATNFDTERTAMWIRAARIYQKHIVAH